MCCCTRVISAVFIYLVLLNISKFRICALKDGEECNDERTRTRGACVTLTNCDYALDLIDKGKSPTFCNRGSEDNFNALVCCQNSGLKKQSLRKPVSFEKCKEYYPELYEELFFVAAVGGTKALSKEYKHMALVGYGDKDEISWSCGGSLISDKFVLTAAHCIFTVAGEPDWVRLGELDTSTNEDDADPQDYKIIKSIPHPGYRIPSIYNDIGLLELELRVNFSQYISPACLPQSPTDSYEFAIATGWGHTSFGGKPSSHLIEVNLILVNHTRCNKVFRGTNREQLSAGINANRQMCAGGNDGKDTCQGDSGGPLQVRKPESKTAIRNVFDVIGITSFGAACGIGNLPAVYTRVFFYLDWIESIVWP